MSDTTSKKPRLQSEINAELQEVAASARRQRERIRQKIGKLDRSSVSSSKKGVPCPNSVLQFSNPTFHTKLPFPFVDGVVPERFKVEGKGGLENWVYMGREKFTELLDKCEELRKDSKHSEVIIYGPSGNGKSHLLAALVCYLAAREQKVVYIPDCWDLIQDPVQYMMSAMLFAWADDKSKQEMIMALETQEEIYQFFRTQKDIIFIIDQLNALEKEKDDDECTANEKAQLRRWLGRLWARSRQKAILSLSANNHSILNRVSRQSSSEIMYVNGGLTRVSLRSNKSFVKMGASNSDLEGDGPVVEADEKGPTRRLHEG